MDIIIGGDMVPTQSNFDLFRKGDALALVGNDLLNLIQSFEYRIFNLETPLSYTDKPIEKAGPNLNALPDVINGFNAIGVNVLTLANNHIMDQDIQGLYSTLEVLEKNNIKYLGVGDSNTTSCLPLIISCKGRKIGIYGCAEHEFSVAGENLPGANPYDPFDTMDHIEELAARVDYVIVLYHGGKEHYRYPSPMLQKTCRKMISNGADLVVCQHSHCVGCMEEYEGGTVVYGQGNFLFDYNDNEYWRTGILVGIDVAEGFRINYYPIVKDHGSVRAASEAVCETVLNEFLGRSEEIKVPGFVEKQYNVFSKSVIGNYLAAFSGRRSIIERAINKISGYRLGDAISRKKYDRKSLVVLKNFLECEAHYEVAVRGINELLRKNE